MRKRKKLPLNPSFLWWRSFNVLRLLWSGSFYAVIRAVQDATCCFPRYPTPLSSISANAQHLLARTIAKGTKPDSTPFPTKHTPAGPSAG